MKDKEHFVFKQLDKSNLEEFDALLRYAFQVTTYDMARTGWSDNEIKQSKKPIFDSSYVLGWFYEGHLASQIVVYPMRVNIHGKIFKMGGVTGVATYPEYTGRGLIHALIQKGLAHMRKEQQYISFLYPYSIPFYRRQGWELVSDKMTFTIRDTQLPRRQPVSGMIRRVQVEHADIKKVYQAFALQQHGALLRGDLEWGEYWRWESDDIMGAVYYNVEGQPTGFVIYYIEKEIFQIKEMVYLNREAKNGIWNYISAHFSMVTKVEGNNYSGEAIAFQFEDSEIDETIKPYIMARIVDVEPFLREFPFESPEKPLQLDFWLTDSVVEWNNGVFRVTLQNGQQSCTRLQPEASRNPIRLDIQTLTTMLMGYKRPTYLYTNERLQLTVAQLHVLESIIPMEKPYFSDYF